MGERLAMADAERWTRSTLGLLETTPDAVVVVDGTGTIVYANRLNEPLFGYRPEDLVGRSVEVLVPAAVRERHHRPRADCGKEPAARGIGSGAHLLGLRRSGREFPVDIALSPIDSDAGRLVIAAVRDMTGRRRIESALRKANEKLERELVTAAKIQTSLLPGRPAGIPGIDVEWLYEPCEKLGGDSFNAFEISDGLVGFYMFDVTGHGMVAALQSVALTRVLASTWTAAGRPSSAQLTKWLNAEFPVDPEVWQCFTFLCGVVDLSAGWLRYATRATRVRSTCRCAASRSPWRPRGCRSAGSTTRSTTSSRCGSTRGTALYLHSDGLTEVMNAAEDDFGVSGLMASLQATRGLTLGETVREVRRAAGGWRGREELDDDLTLLALEVAAG